MALRNSSNKFAINVRASYNDEAAAAVACITRNNFSQVALFYEANDLWAQEGAHAYRLATGAAGLELVVDTSFWMKSSLTYGSSNPLHKIGEVQAVLIASTNAVATTSLITAIRNFADPNFVCLSTVSIGQMQTLFLSLYPPPPLNDVDNQNSTAIVDDSLSSFRKILFTQHVPSVNDLTSSLVSTYLEVMDTYYPAGFIPSQLSLEGYLVGRFTAMAISRVDITVSPSAFINAIYSSSTFQVNEISLGPFSTSESSPCNQGARDVFMLRLGSRGEILSDSSNHFHMDTCGVDYTTINAISINNPMAVRWVFVAIALVVILVALFGLGLTIVFRNLKVVRAKSEVFCFSICIGVIIAVSSVVVKGWEASGAADRDRQCMAGAWTMLIGYAITMSTLLASSVEIFTNWQKGVEPAKVRLSNLKVGLIVGSVTAVALFLIILYTAIDPLTSTLKFNSSDGYHYACTSKHTGKWMAAIYTIMGIMGGANVIISFLYVLLMLASVIVCLLTSIAEHEGTKHHTFPCLLDTPFITACSWLL